MTLGILHGTRRRLARWMVAVLLLAQGFTAAYACPALAAAVPAAVAAPSPALSDCHHGMAPLMDSQQPALCKAHCTADAQATAQAAPDQLPPAAPAAGFDALLPARVALAVAVARGAAPVRFAPPGSPPIYLLHRVLRI